MDSEFHGVVYALAEKVETREGVIWWSPLRDPDDHPYFYRDEYIAKYLARALKAAGHSCKVVVLDTRSEIANF